jgi:hypothetical protein
VSGDNALRQGQTDVNELGTGYIWTNVARQGLTHRNHGEYVDTQWCDMPPGTGSCAQNSIHLGDPLLANVGQPHGSYGINPPKSPSAKESARMDFSHAARRRPVERHPVACEQRQRPYAQTCT